MVSNSATTGLSGGKPAATIYDIARVTGFSPSTVSRALHKPGRVGPDTEKAVRAAADSLGYRINPMARFVTTGRTGTIALVLSDITNPVFFDLVRGAERTTAELGQTLVVAETLGSSEIEQKTVERLLPTVDGVILASSRLDQDLIHRFSEVKKVVLVNRHLDDVPSVVPQLLPGIRDAVNHLAELGHKHIVYLSGPSALWMSRQRFKLLAAECSRAGLSIVSTSSAEPTMEGGRGAVAEVRGGGASAVIAYNDLMAIGLLLACAEDNLAVPGDLSVIGFDDIFGSRFTSPSLTTIRTPLSLVGAEAVRRLAEPKDALPREADDALATEFVLRRSTGPCAVF
ncbi:LacI family DNA-binding transcriptional regulator [Paenarthrobacter aromaticivorans]|uniref:LacI family DNA-binding transcriptional regulator n=1 Tax=Paenarthrobacter aromaticivorans TaxID=2849150 RepID=UPI003A81058B